MIVVAANDGRRPRYALGIAVAALIVAGYVLASGGLNSSPQASPSPAPIIAVPQRSLVVPASPPPLVTPQVVIGEPSFFPTPPPVSRPAQTPRHVLHGGPPLH
jgi:hypothetical protein